jgi:cytochrome c-type biogenesis protein CcmF
MLITLAFFIVGSLAEVVLRTASAGSPGARLRRLAGLPRTMWGAALGHLGVGVTVLGIAALSAFQTEVIADMAPGDTVTVAGYEVTFDRAEQRNGPNYQDAVAVFTVRRDGAVVATLDPARRFYPARQMPTTEASIKTFVFSQLYATLGNVENGKIVVRLYHKPLVTLIWIGALIAAFGGALSLSDRRLRIGLPEPARRRVAAAGAGA